MTTSPPGIDRLRASIRLFAVAGGLFLVGVGAVAGRRQIALMWSGSRARGTIVAYRTIATRDGNSDIHQYAEHPVVHFDTGGHAFEFVDRIGGVADGPPGTMVPVLFLSDTPSSAAVIDRPVWNWIPWGPIAALGIVATLSGMVGIARDGRPSAPTGTAPRAR